jgi:hypothetical protein
MTAGQGTPRGRDDGFGRAQLRGVVPVGTLQPVCLVAVPLRLLKASEDHFDDLFRELQMTMLGRREPLASPVGTERSGRRGSPPAARTGGQVQHLAALGAEVKAYLGGFREPARRAIWEASQTGARLVDIEVVVDAAMLAAFRRCERLLVGAAKAARAGHLLTEPPGSEVEAWRKWVTHELAGQMEGKAPRPCPFPPLRGSSFAG